MKTSRFIFVLVTILVVAAAIWAAATLSGIAMYVIIGGAVSVLACLIILYRRLVMPMTAINIGIRLLHEQDFSSRIRHVGQHNVDNIADTFNRMMAMLKDERIHALEQNHFLDMLIDASPSGIIIFEFDGTIRSANPTARRLLGPDLAGRRLADIDNPLAAACADVAPGHVITIRPGDANVFRCTLLSFIDKGFHRPFMIIDAVTDEVMAAERSAYERIIRIMAHEVNNTVAGILPTLDTFGMITTDSEIGAALDAAVERCRKMSDFITRYAEVVKIPPPDRRPLDLCRFVDGAMPFLESLAAGRGITVVADLPADTPVTVDADAVLLDRVMVNIVKNAVESIDRDGSITIAVAASPPTVTVTDNGKGIPADVTQKLFTPFFSTKASGRGLGLMFVGEILRGHGCRFRLYTDPATHLTHFVIKF